MIKGFASLASLSSPMAFGGIEKRRETRAIQLLPKQFTLPHSSTRTSIWLRLLPFAYLRVPLREDLIKRRCLLCIFDGATGTSPHLVLPSRSYAETRRARSECNHYSRRAPEQSEGH